MYENLKKIVSTIIYMYTYLLSSDLLDKESTLA